MSRRNLCIADLRMDFRAIVHSHITGDEIRVFSPKKRALAKLLNLADDSMQTQLIALKIPSDLVRIIELRAAAMGISPSKLVVEVLEKNIVLE